MLGRRGIKKLREQRDPTERVRQRAMKAIAQGQDNDANVEIKAVPVVSKMEPNTPTAPTKLQPQARRSAKVISFADTPVYRTYGRNQVGPELVYQTLAVLRDRLEEQEVAGSSLDALRTRINGLCDEILEDLGTTLDEAEILDLVDRLVSEVAGLGPIDTLLNDPTVDDIMVNQPDEIYVERRGRLQLTDLCFRNPQHLKRIVYRITEQTGQRLNEIHPVLDGRLYDGSRVNVIIPPIAIDSPTISIRKFRDRSLSLERMVRQGNLSQEIAEVLKAAVSARKNVVIAGGTGSGKTTLLNAMSACFDPDERIVTIEDVAEFKLERDNVVRLETRPKSVLGDYEVTQRGLLKNALRMNPDRIIMGEVRSDEAADLLQAMISGHDGTLSTIHANSARDALDRLEMLMVVGGLEASSASLRGQIAQAVDLVVVVERGRDGLRRIMEVAEITGIEQEAILLQPLFQLKVIGEDRGGHLVADFQNVGQPRFLSEASERDAVQGGED